MGRVCIADTANAATANAALRLAAALAKVRTIIEVFVIVEISPIVAVQQSHVVLDENSLHLDIGAVNRGVPLVLKQAPLRVNGEPDSVRRALEGHHEAIADRFDLIALVPPNRPSHQRVVRVNSGGHGGRRVRPQHSRRLNVCENNRERDRGIFGGEHVGAAGIAEEGKDQHGGANAEQNDAEGREDGHYGDHRRTERLFCGRVGDDQRRIGDRAAAQIKSELPRRRAARLDARGPIAKAEDMHSPSPFGAVAATRGITSASSIGSASNRRATRGG